MSAPHVAREFLPNGLVTLLPDVVAKVCVHLCPASCHDDTRPTPRHTFPFTCRTWADARYTSTSVSESFEPGKAAQG
jgi:hypothetical protein